MLNLLVGRRTSRLDWPGSRAERSAWVESPRPRGCACTAADFWIRRERRPRLRGNAKVCVVLDLLGLGALAPAMILVGLLSRLRYPKAFGACGNFAAPNLERAQVFLKYAAMVRFSNRWFGAITNSRNRRSFARVAFTNSRSFDPVRHESWSRLRLFVIKTLVPESIARCLTFLPIWLSA